MVAFRPALSALSVCPPPFLPAAVASSLQLHPQPALLSDAHSPQQQRSAAPTQCLPEFFFPRKTRRNLVEKYNIREVVRKMINEIPINSRKVAFEGNLKENPHQPRCDFPSLCASFFVSVVSHRALLSPAKFQQIIFFVKIVTPIS